MVLDDYGLDRLLCEEFEICGLDAKKESSDMEVDEYIGDE